MFNPCFIRGPNSDFLPFRMKQPSTAIEITIEIADEQTHLPLDRRLLRRAVRRVLRDAGVRKARISVAVVDDETIARLNWQYLRHRGPADVLSFLLDQSDGLEGEVIVGAQTALRTAPQYGWPPHDELLLYVDPRHVAPGGPRRRQPRPCGPKCRNGKLTYWKALE